MHTLVKRNGFILTILKAEVNVGMRNIVLYNIVCTTASLSELISHIYLVLIRHIEMHWSFSWLYDDKNQNSKIM